MHSGIRTQRQKVHSGKSRAWLIAIALFCVSIASAEVTRIQVDTRGDLPGDIRYGLAGTYEKLAGRIYFAVTPDNAANQVIVDIDHAPLNAAGLVEFSADF